MIYIGIDTGVNTGFAVWDNTRKVFLQIDTKKIHAALRTTLEYHERTNGNICVVFEDARQRKWIPRENSVSQYRGRLMGAGSVKRDAVIWEDFCKDYGIPYEAVPPHKGATKWNEENFSAITGWKSRTSNHSRDAALLVFGR